jgi:hypothetical protein
MDAYKYPTRRLEQQNEPENPMKKDDHAPEALGRFFKGHFGPQSPGKRPKQSSARTTRQGRGRR